MINIFYLAKYIAKTMIANAIRYHINTEKLPLFKYCNKYLIVTKPKTVDEITPKMNGRLIPLRGKSLTSNTNAPIIAGVPIKNENRADCSRFRPIDRAAVIVMPERETPGIKATDWAKPRYKL